jgi:cytidine deaminase
MDLADIDRDDIALFEVAADLLGRRYSDERHRVACAVRTASGGLFTGVSLSARRVAVCGEHVALGAAMAAGDDDIRTVVAVSCSPEQRTAQVVSPCGLCRELLRDLCPQAHVLIGLDGRVVKVRADLLLPGPWVRPSESGRVLGPPQVAPVSSGTDD